MIISLVVVVVLVFVMHKATKPKFEVGRIGIIFIQLCSLFTWVLFVFYCTFLVCVFFIHE